MREFAGSRMQVSPPTFFANAKVAKGGGRFYGTSIKVTMQGQKSGLYGNMLLATSQYIHVAIANRKVAKGNLWHKCTYLAIHME